MRLLPCLFFLMTLLPAIGHCEEPAIHMKTPGKALSTEELFRQTMSKVAARTAKFGAKRSSKIKKINDSYEWTAQAIRLLDERSDVNAAIPLLREASQAYDRNRMAYLLLGLALERSGDRNGAAQAYADFYRNSITLVPFEKDLIGDANLRVFRDYVAFRLKAWGSPLPKEQVSLDVHKARSAARISRSPVGQWINLTLPLCVLIGLVLMLLGRVRHVELSSTAAYFAGTSYVLIVIGYLLWAAHFFMELPFLVTLEFEYALLFGGGAGLILFFYVLNRFMDSRTAPKLEDTKICPKCRSTILKISVECPVCKGKELS